MTYVAAQIIRSHFNNSRIWERALAGEYHLCIKAYRQPKAPKAQGEPPGTYHIIVRIFTDSRELVADVAMYRRQDGTIGASGSPDPKQLVLGNERFFVPAQPPQIHF